MWQTLIKIPNEVYGIPILRSEGSSYGFGLLLLVVLVCGGIGLWNKYRRQGTEGDFAGAAMVLAIICLAIIFVIPRISEPDGLPIRGYGAMLLVAVVSGVLLGMWRANQVGANPEIILSMMFLIFIGGLIGARGLFVIEYWKQFRPAVDLVVRSGDQGKSEEKTIVLDSDTALSLDGQPAQVSELAAGQHVQITARGREPTFLRKEEWEYARRAVAQTSQTELAPSMDGATDEGTIVALRRSWTSILESIGKIADVTKGGIVVYGALLGAAVPFVWYIYRHRLPILPLCDIVVASLLLGQALGRIGCLCNGCCYGSVCEKPNLPQMQFPYQSPPYLHQVEAGKVFVGGLALKKAAENDAVEVAEVEPGSPAEKAGVKPGRRIAAIQLSSKDDPEQAKDVLKAVLDRGSARAGPRSIVDPTVEEAYQLLYRSSGETVAIRLESDKGAALTAWRVQEAAPKKSLPVHPTQLYEAIYAGLMCLFAWLYFPFRRRDGEVFAVMLTMFPFFRFLNEWIRTDEAASFLWGITISQMISIGLLLSAIPFWWWVLRKPAHSMLTPADWAPLNARWAAAAG
jgi:prolipoprotein diacylglyceryltransferase